MNDQNSTFGMPNPVNPVNPVVEPVAAMPAVAPTAPVNGGMFSAPPVFPTTPVAPVTPVTPVIPVAPVMPVTPVIPVMQDVPVVSPTPVTQPEVEPEASISPKLTFKPTNVDVYATPVDPSLPVIPVEMKNGSVDELLKPETKEVEMDDNPFFRIPKLDTVKSTTPIDSTILNVAGVPEIKETPVSNNAVIPPFIPAGTDLNVKVEEKPFNPMYDKIPDEIMQPEMQQANAEPVTKMNNDIPDWLMSVPSSVSEPMAAAKPVISEAPANFVAPVEITPIASVAPVASVPSLAQMTPVTPITTVTPVAPVSQPVSVTPITPVLPVINNVVSAPVVNEVKTEAVAASVTPVMPVVEKVAITEAVKADVKPHVADKKDEEPNDHRVRDIFLVLAVIVLAVLALALGIALATNAIPK